jgi:DNA-binding NarL/FixJ family response regulator
LSPGDLEKNRFKQEPVRWNGKPTHKLEQLTAKQNSVLAELAQGYSNKEIARSLNLSDETVRTHLAGIFRRLGVRNRTQATKRYLLDAQAHT